MFNYLFVRPFPCHAVIDLAALDVSTTDRSLSFMYVITTYSICLFSAMARSFTKQKRRKLLSHDVTHMFLKSRYELL